MGATVWRLEEVSESLELELQASVSCLVLDLVLHLIGVLLNDRVKVNTQVAHNSSAPCRKDFSRVSCLKCV